MKVIIIGNGISGATAARAIRKKSNYEIYIISEETLYPFSRTALMYVFMGHIPLENTKLYEDFFWKKNKIHLIQDTVKTVDFQQKRVLLTSGSEVQYDRLIIASGSKPNIPDWEGKELEGVTGLYHLQDLERLEKLSSIAKKAVVVGGGLIGIEAVEMLHSRGIAVSFLVREKSYWSRVLPEEESQLITKHIFEHSIDLQLNTELKSIHGKDRVEWIVTEDGRKFEADILVAAIGVEPNISFLKSTNLEVKKGILVNENLETSVEDVFAIGDCCELRVSAENRRTIEAVWYTAKAMGEVVARTICGDKSAYRQGIWFNSAKFFDVEYQTYGYVPSELPKDMATVFWQHPQKNNCIRINYLKETKQVVGFNVLGIRFRHEVCENWIATKTPVEVVLRELSKANFDPEFSIHYESELLNCYNQSK